MDINKNFSFITAVQESATFIAENLKTFFIPVFCAFIILFIAGFSFSFAFFSFVNQSESLRWSLYVYYGLTYCMKLIITTAATMAFTVIFFQAVKDKAQLDKLALPQSKSAANIASYAFLIHILPVMLLLSGLYLSYFLFLSRHYVLLAFAVSAIVILFLSIGYMVIFALCIFSPYFYLEQRSFVDGISKSIFAAKSSAIKIFFILLGFYIILAILSALPYIISAVLPYIMTMTESTIPILSVINAFFNFAAFTLIAFMVVVFTNIYLQLTKRPAADAVIENS